VVPDSDVDAGPFPVHNTVARRVVDFVGKPLHPVFDRFRPRCPRPTLVVQASATTVPRP